MSASAKLIALLAWSAFIAGTAFIGGVIATVNHYQVKESKTETRAANKVARKNAKATAVGVRIEQAQDKTDHTFQQIKSDYDADQQNNSAIGCVLDPVSLRRWNAANAGSDGATSSEPDDEVPEVAAGKSEPERSE